MTFCILQPFSAVTEALISALCVHLLGVVGGVWGLWGGPWGGAWQARKPPGCPSAAGRRSRRL